MYNLNCNTYEAVEIYSPENTVWAGEQKWYTTTVYDTSGETMTFSFHV